VIIEVMVEDLNHSWWASYRDILRDRFRQDTLVIRTLSMAIL
jgi:hypothetical protein